MTRRPKEKWLRKWTDRDLTLIDNRATAIRQEEVMDEQSAWLNAEIEHAQETGGNVCLR